MTSPMSPLASEPHTPRSPTAPSGTDEAHIACAFVADALADLAARIVGREDAFATTPEWLEGARGFVATFRDPGYLASLVGNEGDRHLDPDFELVRETFHRFAAEEIRPHAEHIHRANADIPEEIITGLAEMGALGLVDPRGVRRASPPEAPATTWGWWWPPRSCPGARSVPGARSSPAPRS